MSDNTATGDNCNQNGGSLLFCTPPPEERHVCADLAIAEEICPVSAPNLREAQPPALAGSRLTSATCVVEAAHGNLAVDFLRQLKPSRKSSRKQSPKHFLATVTDPETDLKLRLRGQELMYPRGSRSIDPKMRASGESITMSVASDKGQSGLPRSHLLDGKTDESRPVAFSFEEPRRNSGTRRDSKPTQSHGLLGIFTGYSSSDGEDEGTVFEAKRKTIAHQPALASNNTRKSKKSRQPKPAELVVSDTDNSSESEPCEATAPLLLQNKDISSRSSIHRPISSVQSKKAEQGRAPRLQRRVPGHSPSATIKPKAQITASARQRNHTIMNNMAMRATSQKGVKQPARSVIVKKQRTRRGPFILDSDTESDDDSDSKSKSSTEVEAEGKGLEDEDDDDNWDAIPSIQPFERQSLDNRKAVSTAPRPSSQKPSLTKLKAASSSSSQRAPAFDKAKLKAMLLAKKKNQPKFHASPGALTEGQSVLATTKISTKTAQESPKSRPGTQQVQQRYVPSPSIGASKLQSIPPATPQASLSTQTSGAKLQLSPSTKPASKAARPAGLSQNETSPSGRESGPTQNLPKQSIARKQNFEASRATQSPKCSTQGATPVRKQNSGQSAGSVGLVGSLIQGIRQSEKPIDGTLKNTAVSAVESNPQSQHHGQTRDRPQTGRNVSGGTSDMEPRSDGVTRAKTNVTPQSSESSTSGRAGAVAGQNKVVQSYIPGTKSSDRTEATQAHSISVANSNPQTSPNMVPTLKRKSTVVGSGSSSETPLHKKPKTVAEPSVTQPLAMEPRTGTVPAGANVLSSTKRALGTLTARKPAETAPSPANAGSNLQGPALKHPVYKTLQTPLKNISGGHDTQTATAKNDLAPTRPKISEFFKSKETAVESEAQMSQMKTVAPRKASVSVVVPSKSNTVLATPEAKNAADTKIKQHTNRGSEKPFDDKMEDVRPGSSAPEVRRKVRELPGNLDKSGLPTGCGSTISPTVRPLAKDSESIAKVVGKDQQPQTVASAKSSTSLPTDYPPKITANKATSHAEPQSQSNEPVAARGIGSANLSTCKGKEKRSDMPESVAPSGRLESHTDVSIRPPTVAQKVPAEGKPVDKDTTKKAPEVSHVPTVAALQPPLSLPGTASSIFNLPSLPPLPSDSEPYFEYSIFSKIWSASREESSIDATELTLAPCTNIDVANTHVETLFNNAREQYQQHFAVQFSGWTNDPDDHGCSVFLGTFAPIEYASRKSCIKFWVERHTVSADAGRTPKDLKHTSFVARTVYMLRLFRLLPATPDSDGETEDTTGTAASTRAHHPLPHTECYTTLDAANRAAKNLQIEMSHKPNPSRFDEMFQTKNAADLNQKVNDLRQAKDDEGRYWKSKFHDSGMGSEFELLVEKAGLCGPRNL